MSSPTATRAPLSMDELAEVIAHDIAEGSYVNLGIGQPTKIADHLPPERGVVLHTENGMLGMGPAAYGEQVDAELTNAGKVPVTELPGASYFHHADACGAATSTSACSVPTRSPATATWPTGTPGGPTPSRRSAARWTSRSAPRTCS